jgi:glycosyltransferase involved in cell wall biosynthesis
VLCGSGWRDWLGDRPHVVFADSLDYLDLAKLYRQARIVVSVNAANGASERVMMAMAAGAAVISDYSPHLVDALGDAISVYNRVQMNSVVELVGALGRNAGAQEQAARGAAASRRHTWVTRAEQIAEELRRLD